MSLETPPPVKTYRLGVVAAKNLDDPSFLSDLISENVPAISHLYTNGANALVTDFAREHGIPYTVFPLNGGRSLPWSNSRIVETSDFVYVIGTTSSKSAGQAVAACVAAKVKHRLISYDPCTHWRERVQAMGAALAVITPADAARIGGLLDQLKEIV